MTVRVDWFRVFVDLERAGCSLNIVAERIGIHRETLRSWRNRDTEPSYRGGAALVAVWCEVTGKVATELPALRAATLSAARAK